MAWPKLSIVVFSGADPGGCVRTLTSCERLEHDDIEFELILVLQGLTGKVESMLKDYAFSFDLKFVSAGDNSTRAAGRNLGVAAASHEIILFLDSALEASPELLYCHLEEFKEKETAAVMGELFLPPFVKKSRWFRFLDSNYRGIRRWAAQEGADGTPQLRYLNTANFSVRKNRYLACGGHNENIDNHEAENIDLAYRLSTLGGGDIRFQPEAVAFCQHLPLKASLESKYEFGKKGIPKLLENHPELYLHLPSRFVQIEGFPLNSLAYRMGTSLLFNSAVLFIARGIRLLSPEFMAFRMMRYMLQYETVRGMKHSVKALVVNRKQASSVAEH